MHQSLQSGFQKSPYLLLIGSVCSAVFKSENLYYLFDSHSHSPSGLSDIDGKSVLISFSSFTDLITFMYALYKSMLIDLNGQFDLLPVTFSCKQMNQCTSHSFPDAADTSTCQDYSSIRLQSYFHDQFSKQRRKRDICQQQEMEPIETVACKIRKRNDYMKT